MLMTGLGNIADIDPWLEPHRIKLDDLQGYIDAKSAEILDGTGLTDFALGHLHYGLHQTGDGWVFREWAPNATSMYLVNDSTGWQDDQKYRLHATDNGNWELKLPLSALKHGDKYKLHLYWVGGDGYRIPSYADYVVQDEQTKDFNAVVWQPKRDFQWTDTGFRPADKKPFIYEAHVGMSGDREAVSSYRQFADEVLPRIDELGYNTIQLMAIQEHPYYGSFGYHVSSYFAASSRFGTPDDLKYLIDQAHNKGIAVILDIVHSHAVKNEIEGLSRFDGSLTQYFHAGERGNHSAWDSRVFDYGKPQVAHFLLSNLRFWLDEYHFDGFRFDGVTSMLYYDHGLERAFSSYDTYFEGIDRDAITYLSLANQLTHAIKPTALTIAEDMSAFPGLAASKDVGGIGFDYRLSMGVPDIWIKTLKEKRDEDWNLDFLFHELSTHRPEEVVISYAESHDQALVGDKTIIFRLIDKEMYWHMRVDDEHDIVDRGVALHKMIRLLTASANGGGYLNFMGNEFGHPEWIDFPREGNDWSYKYARRQWSLVDDNKLKYQYLNNFDKAMVQLVSSVHDQDFHWVNIQNDQHVLSFIRGDLLFVYNFAPNQSYTDFPVPAKPGDYQLVLSSDEAEYGGYDRVDTTLAYMTSGEKESQLKLYLPARTALVFRHQ